MSFFSFLGRPGSLPSGRVGDMRMVYCIPFIPLRKRRRRASRLYCACASLCAKPPRSFLRSLFASKRPFASALRAMPAAIPAACAPSENKKRRSLCSSFLCVPGAGIEPARVLPHRFLRPTRLPIPPPGHRCFFRLQRYNFFQCKCNRLQNFSELSIFPLVKKRYRRFRNAPGGSHFQ